MRPAGILACAACLALSTLVLAARADNTPPPPAISVGGGTITVTAQGTTHMNPKYPWKYLDSTGAKAKALADFAFTGGTSDAPNVATVSGAPAGGTLRGGYCQDSGCSTFTASCTASACTITGP